jgi:pimeloyl-ACP methyl ester carboxylesterase
MIATVNGVRLAYSDTGEGSPVALLVHGFPLNRSMWDAQRGTLRSLGLRVIAPDLRGFGASEAGPPGPLTMDQHADDLVALLEQVSVAEPVIYVGLSMGGYIAFALWRRHPERVAAFVLADTRASEDTPAGREDRLRMAQLAEAQNSPQPAIDGMLPRFFSPHLRAGSLPEQRVRGMIVSSSPRAVADGQRGLAARPASFETLPTINVPTLVLVGEHDMLTPPSDAQALADGIPNAKLVTIDQAGHMSNMENPEAFNAALVDFVGSLPS